MRVRILFLSVFFIIQSCSDTPTGNINKDSGFIKFDLKADSRFLDCFFLDKNYGWACTKTEVWRTTNGGADWEKYSMPPYSFHGTVVLFFSDSLNGWVTGKNNSLNKTTDGGKTWTEIPFTSGGSSSVNDVFFLNSNTGYFITSSDFYFAYINKTTDGGNSWINTKISKSEIFEGIVLYNIKFIDDYTGFISGNEINNDSTYGFLLKTSDGGLNWKKTNFISNHNLTEICFINNSTGWINAGNLLYKTTDGGNNWFTQKPLGSKAIRKICFADDKTGWLTQFKEYVDDNTFDSYQMQKTTDGGSTWHYVNKVFPYEENPNNDPDIADMAFADKNTGWFFTITGYIFKTSNGGNVVR